MPPNCWLTIPKGYLANRKQANVKDKYGIWRYMPRNLGGPARKVRPYVNSPPATNAHALDAKSQAGGSLALGDLKGAVQIGFHDIAGVERYREEHVNYRVALGGWAITHDEILVPDTVSAALHRIAA